MTGKTPDEILAVLHDMAGRLYEAYRTNTSSPELTEDLLGCLRYMKCERHPDGTVILKTPSLTDTRLVTALAEVTNRGLSYLTGIDMDPAKDVRRAHSDIFKDLSLTALSQDIFGSIVPRADHNHINDYDHIIFKISPEKIARARAHLPHDDRRDAAINFLDALQPEKRGQLSPSASAVPTWKM